MINDNSTGLSGLLSAVLAQTSAIQVADSAVDSRANNIMAAALVVIPLLGTQLIDERGHWHWLVVVPMTLMVGAIFMVVYVTRSRQYAGAVVDLTVYQEYFAKEDSELLAQLIEDANQANDWNSKIMESKLKLLKHTVSLFLFGFAMGLISLFVTH